MNARRRERWMQILLAVMLFACYAYFLPRPQDWNQNGRMDLVLSIVDRGSLAIDAYRDNTGDYAHFGEHYYSDKAPGASFVGVPFYWAFRTLAGLPLMQEWLPALAGRLLPWPANALEAAGVLPWRGYFLLAMYATVLGASVLPATTLGLLLYRLARRLGASRRDAALLTVVYGLGTPVFPYGAAFYGHALTAFCLFGAWYLLIGTREHAPSPLRLMAAGFLLGWAVISEYPMILPAGVIGLYAIYRLRDVRRLAWVVLGGLAPAALLAAYDMAIYGTPLPVGYKHSELWQEEVNTGFMTLTLPSLERLWGITFSPYRGLFFLSPALLLAVPGLWRWWREREWRAEWITLLAVVVALFLFNASSVVWWGGYAVGPRYVLPSAPFLALPIAVWLRPAGWRRAAFLAVGMVSMAEVWMQTITALPYFPPQQFHFPLLEYALPLLWQRQIAPSWGLLLDNGGWSQLLPLIALMVGMTAALWWAGRPAAVEVA